MRAMRLSDKNANFIMPQTIEVAQLLDDGHGDVKDEIFGIVIQPSDGRRTVVCLPRKELGELSIQILETLTGKSKEEIGEIPED